MHIFAMSYVSCICDVSHLLGSLKLKERLNWEW